MRKFHRTKGKRKVFLRILAGNLIIKGRMETTVARAKEIRPMLERLVTIAKKQNLASLRILIAKLPKKSAEKLYYEIAPKNKTRKGGYLRIIKNTKLRKRDNAPMAMIEFI